MNIDNLPQKSTRKALKGLFVFSLLFSLFLQPLSAQIVSSSVTRDDWNLGLQAWTFRMVTFSDALDKADSCGIKFIEAFPGQKIGGGIEGTMDFTMDSLTRQKVLDLLRTKGITMVSYGVVTPKTDSAWIQLFRFARAMGLQNIVTEPRESDIPLISKLCDEYEIDAAIHNHPAPSYYWDPEVILKAVRDASPRVGACADVGHWIRSGLDPVACLQKLEGRVKEFHMKDLNEKGVRKAHDMPWGKGISNIVSIMQEMKRQHFRGLVAIEYEYKWENNVPDVKASAAFFEKEKAKLLMRQ